jgi:hypothetical protein
MLTLQDYARHRRGGPAGCRTHGEGFRPRDRSPHLVKKPSERESGRSVSLGDRPRPEASAG